MMGELGIGRIWAMGMGEKYVLGHVLLGDGEILLILQKNPAICGASEEEHAEYWEVRNNI